MSSEIKPRVVKVLVHIECECFYCDMPAIYFGLAAVLPDGRIGEPDPFTIDENTMCRVCRDQKSLDEREAYNKARRQTAWVRKAKAKTGIR